MRDIFAASIAKLSMGEIAHNLSMTQKQCDQKAEQLVHMPVHPASVQGGNSYTVASDDENCVVQFHSGSSSLDMSFHGCIELAYEGFTPRHKFVANMRTPRLHDG